MPHNVVVIGGGHGQAEICRGIKNIPGIRLHAIVTVADDGGSTGRLRRKFNIPAMGDIRNVMVALAEKETVLRSLMDYRFDDPEGTQEDIAGHNLGNLILTALTKQCGSFFEAVQIIDDVLNVKGDIIPATEQVITLYAKMEDGVIVQGEANIPHLDNRIVKVFYDEDVKASPEAVEAVLHADLIILGIGSVYTSILPNVIIPEIREALAKTQGRKVYFCNAMTQPGETDGYSVEDHMQALADHGAYPDTVIIADDSIPAENEANYLAESSVPVRCVHRDHAYKVVRTSLLDFDKGLIRHDAEKIHRVVEKLLNGEM